MISNGGILAINEYSLPPTVIVADEPLSPPILYYGWPRRRTVHLLCDPAIP